MKFFEEVPKLLNIITDSGVPYALIGGVAMAFHNEPRFTRDTDILVKKADIDSVSAILLKQGFIESAPGWDFHETGLSLYRFMKIQGEDHFQVDVLVSEDSQYETVIQNAIEAESEYGKAYVATKDDLVRLKKIRGSNQDKADIEKLKDA
jgi:hypothetical protein